MLKRTKGRLLITLLVVTGLAGTLNTSSLSQKERKQAVMLLKTTRSQVSNAVDGLSDKQLNYRSSLRLTIADITKQLALAEEDFSRQLAIVMDRPSDAEKRLLLCYKDDELMRADISSTSLYKSSGISNDKDVNVKETLASFITLRNANIKYLRTSTEDLRNHVIESGIGWVDYYQKFLILGKQTRYAFLQIEKIKSEKNFPK